MKPKQPLALAILKGADKKDPQRYRDPTAQSDEPLGDHPGLSGHALKAWRDLEKNSIPGVLTGADRFMMEIAATLLGEFRDDPSEFAVGKYGQLISCLARLGLSPADRQKVRAPEKPKSNDGFNQFS